MKSISLIPVALAVSLSVNQLSAQTRMTLDLDGKISDIFGYSLDPSPGSSKEITLFGPMQNAAVSFEFGLESGKLFPSIDLTVTDAVTGTTSISLSNVTVLAVKQFISTYTNGSFTVSPGGNVNTEVKCRFEKIEIKTGSSKNKIHPGDINPGAGGNEEKWVISNASIKGGTGKISVDLAEDVEGNIQVYDPANNNKYMGSFRKNDPILLFPGNYKVKLSNAEVQNLTVQAGMNTRLKAGVISFNSAVNYQIFDADKKYLASYKGPKKIGLPVGTYQLNLNGRFQRFVIKDGEMLEF